MKRYIKQKEENKLVVTMTQQSKYAKAFKKVPHSYSEDGRLRFGDKVMMLNKKTEGYLVLDLGDHITTHDEAYATTTSKKAAAPSARNIFVLEKAEEDDYDDDVIHFGQKIRILANKHITGKNLYLHSCQISPLCYARFSRNQEVCMHIKKNYNTVWTVEDMSPVTRKSSMGKSVPANGGIVLRHCATGNMLASDLVDYRNDYGMEYEVCVNSFATKNKSQNLALESAGAIGSDTPTKFQQDQNVWMF